MTDPYVAALEAMTEAVRSVRVSTEATVEQLHREMAELRDGLVQVDERVGRLAYQAELRANREERA